jgi:hypothetical protein
VHCTRLSTKVHSSSCGGTATARLCCRAAMGSPQDYHFPLDALGKQGFIGHSVLEQDVNLGSRAYVWSRIGRRSFFPGRHFKSTSSIAASISPLQPLA